MSQRLCFELDPGGGVVLALGPRCIQSAARQAHRELVRALLDERPVDARWESAAGLLERFVTTTRFAELRTVHPELSGTTRCRIRLAEQSDGEITWQRLPLR